MVRQILLAIWVLVAPFMLSSRVLGQPLENEESTGSEDEGSAIVQRVFELTNEARVQNGLPPLVRVLYLEVAAQGHSQEMARLDYFAHRSPIPERATTRQRIALAGGWDTSTAENIYRAVTDNADRIADSAVREWLLSPAHRKNIMNASFNSIGVGLAREGNEFYVTQDFSRQSIIVREFTAAPSAGGYEVTLIGAVRDGGSDGAIFVDDAMTGTFQADGSGYFTFRATVPAHSRLTVSQRTGPYRFHTGLVLPVEAGLHPSGSR